MRVFIYFVVFVSPPMVVRALRACELRRGAAGPVDLRAKLLRNAAFASKTSAADFVLGRESSAATLGLIVATFSVTALLECCLVGFGTRFFLRNAL